jgi:hypothetical protein
MTESVADRVESKARPAAAVDRALHRSYSVLDVMDRENTVFA